jgi:hypothetical protein
MRAEATDAYTPGGRYIIVVYEEIDDRTIMPWTAYEVSEP